MGIVKTWHDRFLFRVNNFRFLTDHRPDRLVGPNCNKATVSNRKGFGSRLVRINGQNLRVHDDQVGRLLWLLCNGTASESGN